MLDDPRDRDRKGESRGEGDQPTQTPFKIRAARQLRKIVGTWIFLASVLLLIAAWIVLQLTLPHPFDPFPFLGLNLLLTVCAAVQGVVIMIAERDE